MATAFLGHGQAHLCTAQRSQRGLDVHACRPIFPKENAPEGARENAPEVATGIAPDVAPIGVVKRDEHDLQDWLKSEAGFVDSLCRYNDDPVVLEPFQRSFLLNRSRFRWTTKSRQVGNSFVFALAALARCHLRDGHTAVFVSFNQEDAKEKILIARQVFEELPLAYQKRLVVYSKTELASESTGSGRRLSRILSVPSKPPRGKKGDVYLDELAHYVNDREVYRGSTALILRSNGQLTGCSTPLGRRGIFWEITNEELRKYPHHTRQHVPWWLCRFFTTDVKAASELALDLPTEERVEQSAGDDRNKNPSTGIAERDEPQPRGTEKQKSTTTILSAPGRKNEQPRASGVFFSVPFTGCRNSHSTRMPSRSSR